MGFRWTNSLVLLYFLVFLSSVIVFSFTFAIGTWYIVFLLVIFLLRCFFPSLLISLILDFICSWGPKSFGPWG